MPSQLPSLLLLVDLINPHSACIIVVNKCIKKSKLISLSLFSPSLVLLCSLLSLSLLSNLYENYKRRRKQGNNNNNKQYILYICIVSQTHYHIALYNFIIFPCLSRLCSACDEKFCFPSFPLSLTHSKLDRNKRKHYS